MADLLGTIKGLVSFLQTLKAIYDEVEGNRTDLRTLAGNIITSLLRIEGAVKRHQDQLSSAPYVEEAVQELEIELQTILSKCQRMLFPENGQSTLGRVKHIFTEWKDREEIRTQMTRMEKNVDNICMRFLVDMSTSTAIGVGHLHVRVEEMHVTMNEMRGQMDRLVETTLETRTTTLQLSEPQEVTPLTHDTQANQVSEGALVSTRPDYTRRTATFATVSTEPAKGPSFYSGQAAELRRRARVTVPIPHASSRVDNEHEDSLDEFVSVLVPGDGWESHGHSRPLETDAADGIRFPESHFSGSFPIPGSWTTGPHDSMVHPSSEGTNHFVGGFR